MDSRIDAVYFHVLTEFVAATVDRSVVLKEDKIRAAFNFFDRSHRGSISVKDLTSVFGTEAQAREIMGSIDLDHDGHISYAEFHAMMESRDK